MSDDEKPLDPEAARVVARIRRLMMIASATTFLAVAVVLAVIGYRVFHLQGSAPPAFPVATATLPAGAKVISTAIGDNQLAITIETAAGIEIRMFDARTFKPAGRLVFAKEP
ncbi:MAG: hypothetical protein HYX37_01740 [Rhizobiales bacterium]|nr:hypothetical protein [Hyphomicrobiales bacterium]